MTYYLFKKMKVFPVDIWDLANYDADEDFEKVRKAQYSVDLRLNVGYNMSMDTTVQAELDKLKDLIINAIPVEQIYLFGSYAYGNPQKDSDLDLYVVLKDDVQMRDLDAGLQIRFAIDRKKSMPVDIVAKKKRDFLNLLDDVTLERKVNRDGIRIYG